MTLVQGTTEAEWRQFGLSKGFGAETPSLLDTGESNSTPLQTGRTSASSSRVQSYMSDTTRKSLVCSDSSAPTLIGNANEALGNPRHTHERRTSEPVRGRSISISSTTPPARPASRAQSFHSEISEYGPDGKLIKSKTITTTYSAEVVSHSHSQTQNQTRTRRRASLSFSGPAPSKEQSDNNLYGSHRVGLFGRSRSNGQAQSQSNPNADPTPTFNQKADSAHRDYETMYTSRTRQLKTLVRKLVELDMINFDPFNYRHDQVEVAAGDFAVESICLALAGSVMGEGKGKNRTGKRRTHGGSSGGVDVDVAGKGPAVSRRLWFREWPKHA